MRGLGVPFGDGGAEGRGNPLDAKAGDLISRPCAEPFPSPPAPRPFLVKLCLKLQIFN